ncbi:MAG TPA: twin-arginine translocase subunit TatC [Planctomycetota bacterium]|nr:twin-arginine translocase subunit TatC [Planctomycetota bacterium]HRR80488.1 twin-arginine translocase subunit TatC [Planctomycetota bacterium]HRT97339.1 twin-arginine translocase subunit TatC [Planctomycetota bacterium]
MPDDPFDDATNEEDEFGIDPKRMTFLEHLLELRWRLMICIGTVVLATIVFFVALRGTIFEWLRYPIVRACQINGKINAEDLIFVRTPTSLFMASVYYCLLAAVAVTIPVTVWQLWAFVAPGLKRKERRVIGPAIVSAMVLFLAGAAFAYYVVIPIMLQFFLQDTQWMGAKPLWDIAETVKLEALMMLVLGVTFEMPLLIVALTKIGIVSPRFLSKYRRHAILVIFIIAALITPTQDPVTLGLVAGPLVLLYELGLQASRLFKPRRARWDVLEDEPPPPPKAPEPPPPSPDVPSAPPDQAPPPQDVTGEGEPLYEDQTYHAGSEVQEEPWAPEATEPLPEEHAPAAEPQEPEHKPQPEAEPAPPAEELPPEAMMH